MIIGLPHSSQSMSVGILCGTPLEGSAAPPITLATSACASAALCFNAGTNDSTCFNSSPASFAIVLIPRHFGNVAQPSHGPRLPSRSTIAPPHFSHLIAVGIGLALGGSGFPSLSRLIIVLHSGYPE